MTTPRVDPPAPRPRRCRASVSLLAFVLVGSLLTGAAIALAGTLVPDGDDSAGALDISSAEASRTEKGRIRYRIETFEGFARSDAPCIQLKAGLHRVGYRICGSGRVTRLSNGAKSGTAVVARPDPSAIVYTIGPAAIGSPSFHKWKAVVLRKRCPQGVCDSVPDNGWVTFARTVTYGQWARVFLSEMHVPRCESNLIVTVAWEVNEGTAAVWNPLATTYSMPGNTTYNSHGVKNYVNQGQGLTATRLTIERGWRVYGYGKIVNKLDRCAAPLETARAINGSSWCAGCTDGKYVTGLIREVKQDYGTYAARLIATSL
ncbi:MAG: hypothetical protein WD556_11210 [Actinomycetota bacterium]